VDASLLMLARERLAAIGIRNSTLQVEPLPTPSAEGTPEAAALPP
jgi:hypothetical protein